MNASSSQSQSPTQARIPDWAFQWKGKIVIYKKQKQQRATKVPTPKRVVNDIFGGEEVNGVTFTAAKKFTKMSNSYEKRTRQTLTRESMVFDDEDVDGLNMPHNDAVVITLRNFETEVRKILIDPGSLTNIV